MRCTATIAAVGAGGDGAVADRAADSDGGPRRTTMITSERTSTLPVDSVRTLPVGSVWYDKEDKMKLVYYTCVYVVLVSLTSPQDPCSSSSVVKSS